MWLVMLRWLFSLGLVVLIALPQIRRDWRVLRQNLVLLGILGATGFALFNGLLYTSAHYTSAVNISILQGAIPIFVLLGLWLLPGGTFGWIQGLGVFMTLAGVAIVATGGDPQVLSTLKLNLGDVLILCACVLYAGYTVWLRQRPAVAPLSQFAIMATGAWFTALVMLLCEVVFAPQPLPTATGVTIALATAVFPSLLAQVWFIRGVGLIGPARAGIFVNLVPVQASLLAVLILGEAFGLHHALALGLVLGGIGLSERTRVA